VGLVDADGRAVLLVDLVQFVVVWGLEVELVREAAAAAADDAHAEINLLRRPAVVLLLGNDPLDFAGRFFGQSNWHGNNSCETEDARRLPSPGLQLHSILPAQGPERD